MSAFFKSIQVLPFYGARKAVLVWDTTDPGDSQGKFFIYRSQNGLSNFQKIGTVEGQTFFEDEDFIPTGNQTDAYYRVSAQTPTGLQQSQSVATFGDVSRLEFGQAAVIVQQEFQQLRLNKPLAFTKLRVAGEKCRMCSDKQTGQSRSASSCDNCYGTAFEGGFLPSTRTFARKIGASKRQVADEQQERLGSKDTEQVLWRMLAIPVLHRGDMLVEPDTDRRFLVDVVQPFMVAGKYPVIQEIESTILPRNDIRYKFDIPRNP